MVTFMDTPDKNDAETQERNVRHGPSAVEDLRRDIVDLHAYK